MPPPKSSVPPAAQPKYSNYFDAWNSSSTGHQKAENALGHSIGWRQSRNMKLSHQFKSGDNGGKRISDQVGAGAENWDEKAKALIPKDVRQRAIYSVADMVTGKEPSGSIAVSLSKEEKLMAQRKKEDEQKEEEKSSRKKGVFDGLVIYVNGSTYPMISDHKLKHVLAKNGARMSLHLGRRQVTHVILGKPSGILGHGAGGGLSGTKMQKEIRRVGGCGVKYVGVEWVLESLKAGKRLSETSFSNLRVAPRGQKSVYGMFQKEDTTDSTGGSESDI
ncbi:uncharacterized protein RAG0_09257 [Rhynchosporium agropyri]|uniref:BRCT domain-containing protein n=1 Tax=Rhynchosporium agropyri TaxID=914238 RepID=A0A1E1KUM3_9HELO|nr:uncharacterized protein RAG0_09257 [Rhynchosporium agropyri]